MQVASNVLYIDIEFDSFPYDPTIILEQRYLSNERKIKLGGLNPGNS
jgi:hypothetical protein